jgi:hypothetical protein
MKLTLTMELDIESGLDFKSIIPLVNAIEEYFKSRNYGDGLNRIVVIAVCRPKYLNLAQRQELDTENKTIYIDAMIDFESIALVHDVDKKKQLFHEQLSNGISNIDKYKKSISNFDFANFLKDYKTFFWEFSWW